MWMDSALRRVYRASDVSLPQAVSELEEGNGSPWPCLRQSESEVHEKQCAKRSEVKPGEFNFVEIKDVCGQSRMDLRASDRISLSQN